MCYDFQFVFCVFSIKRSTSCYPEIRRLFPNALIRHISGAGHFTHAEKPQEFMNFVADFVEQNPLWWY